MARFKKDAAAQKALANTVKLADSKAEDFDTVTAACPVPVVMAGPDYQSGQLGIVISTDEGNDNDHVPWLAQRRSDDRAERRAGTRRIAESGKDSSGRKLYSPQNNLSGADTGGVVVIRHRN